MATLVNGKQQDQEQGPVDQQGPINVSGTPTSTIGAGPVPAPGTPARKASGSGRFTNIQNYLQASQGSGEKIAGSIGQRVGQQTEKLGQAVNAANAINPQLEAERNRIAQATGFNQQLQQDPTKLVQDPNQLAAFTQLRTGQTGLQPLKQQAQQSFDTAQSELGKVQELAGLTGNEAGRFELLRQSLGRPSYTRGQQKLDQLLVQSGGGNILGQLQKTTQGQAQAGQQLLGTTKSDIENRLAGLGTEAEGAQKLLTETLGGWDNPATAENEATGILGRMQTDLTGRAKTKQGQLEDLYSRARSGLESGTIDKDVADMLGLTGMNIAAPEYLPDASRTTASNLLPGQNEILLGNVSPEDLISRLQKGFTTVTPSGVANEQDYANLQALKQLSGQTGPTPIELDKSQLGQAGYAAKLNAEQLQKDIQSSIGGIQKQFEGTELDPLGAQLLYGQGAQSLLNKDLNMSDTQLMQKYGSVFQDPKVLGGTPSPNFIRQKLSEASSGIGALNSTGQVDPRLAVGGLINRGATYGNLTQGGNFLVDNLKAVLNTVNPTLADTLTKGLTGEQLKNVTSGTDFGKELTKRMTQKYTDLGLGKKLKIKQ